MTVWIYVDTSEQVGDKDHLKVFASADIPPSDDLPSHELEGHSARVCMPGPKNSAARSLRGGPFVLSPSSSLRIIRSEATPAWANVLALWCSGAPSLSKIYSGKVA